LERDGKGILHSGKIEGKNMKIETLGKDLEKESNQINFKL